MNVIIKETNKTKILLELMVVRILRNLLLGRRAVCEGLVNTYKSLKSKIISSPLTIT